MKSEIFEYWTKSGNIFSKSMKALIEINTKAFTNLTEQQQALVTNLSEVCAHQIQLATESKGYAELLSGQAELAAEQREKLLAIVSDTASVLKAARAELTVWVEKGFEAALQPLGKVAGAKQAA
ncbi:MAG: phasin family protein [Gammaproteobacteria bacterium]